ncbi:Ig-like domain-containing protein [Fulvivirga lutea]|uniref:Ig-like domain-containing protein n=1 Tax=Fulvivirga lutea TaxID=2810512 RepID=A0A975A1G1_9BACT|nr:Ig-like domain-containing protein [Fulvivirga lutea]QSE98271.1 Ig-like domain-containing protein [Fulvivirga lutea]
MRKILGMIFLATLSACIGTDVVNDPLVDPTLTIEDDDKLVTLLVGDTEQLTVLYMNETGAAESVDPIWMVDNSDIATVNNDGLVTASAKGQTNLRATFNGISSLDVLISVAENMDDIVKVLITEPEKSKIDVGEMLQLSATGWNLSNMQVVDGVVTWEVDNESVATISEAGVLTGISNGNVKITASIDGVNSVPVEVEVGSNALTAQFEGRSGYTAVGTATLDTNDDGDIILTLSDDFRTSFALGTFIYLSNSTSGSETKGGGLQLGEITTNGAKTFNVSQANASVTLNTYRYVIVLCFPASITFGLADFQK